MVGSWWGRNKVSPQPPNESAENSDESLFCARSVTVRLSVAAGLLRSRAMFGEMTMLPGLPPRDKSFKGWLRSLVIPIAVFTSILTVVGALSCLLADGSATFDFQRYAGGAGAIRIVLAAPFFFAGFLLLATFICWVNSLSSNADRKTPWRGRNKVFPQPPNESAENSDESLF